MPKPRLCVGIGPSGRRSESKIHEGRFGLFGVYEIQGVWERPIAKFCRVTERGAQEQVTTGRNRSLERRDRHSSMC